MKEIEINKREEGQKLIRFLGRYLPEAGSGFLHKMIRKKNITLNEKKTEAGAVLASGDRIQIYFSRETLDKFRGNESEPARAGQESDRDRKLRRQVKVLYRTPDILALHKPAGMLTQKARPEDDSLNDYLLDLCLEEGIWSEDQAFRPSVANRLDRNTSGIVLCGISIRGLQDLSRCLKERSARKYYLAIVHGQVREGASIHGYLVKDRKTNKVTVHEEAAAGASRIETAYQVVSATKEASLLKIDLITGRSHQIRAHLAHEGHPLVGDRKYGTAGARPRRETGRPMLHCYQIQLPQAESGTITDPVPEEFQREMKARGLWAEDLVLS